ncbi:MAG: TIGR03986 family CRISPR-associated RAMP protein [Bacillota bacterium]|nr:TIGR03986 family CRISPR-associated RAMP protein [Bacillota bacterium]
MGYKGNSRNSFQQNRPQSYNSNSGPLHTFINPYNFISIESCQREQYPEDGNLTGYMDCVLTTKTPLIMVDSSKKEESRFTKDHFIYKYPFTIDNKPAIPASSLRGMIRSKFETLTNSCFSTADTELAFVTRSKMTLDKAGLLHVVEGQKAELFEADRIEINYEYDKIRNHKSGDIVKFDTAVDRDGYDYYVEKDNGRQIAIFRKGEKFQGTTHDFLYCLVDKNENRITLDSKNKVKVNCGDDVLALYNQSAAFHKANKEQYQKKEIKDGNFNHASYCESEWRPVWWKNNDFSISEGHIYLSLSSNGQLEYGNHLGDLLTKPGKQSYQPCEDESHICEACRVFGNVQDAYSLTGKVRFEDGILLSQTKNYFAYPDSLTTLPILASPRFTNANFYLYSQDMLKDDFSSLSPDYKVKFGKQKGQKRASANPIEYNDPVHIRGRKEYWHFSPKNYKEAEGNQNVTVKPLKDNLEFGFRVYFENLTEEELLHLYLSICLGNDSTHKYYHKLGMGKSLGFGSVKVDVKNIKTKNTVFRNGKIERTIEDYQLDIPQGKDPLLSGFKTLSYRQQEEIKAMYNFDYLKQDKYRNVIVDYPRQQKDKEIFKWFQSNPKVVLPFADKQINLKAAPKKK